jgi:NAD(P)-dependent dehydrogenase (short-subunit alcohol dehydrogenase family)
MFGMGPAWQRYHQTKLANSLSTMILHDKLKEKGSKVKAICVAPGLAATDLQVRRILWGGWDRKGWDEDVAEGSTMILHDKLKEEGSKVKAICVAPGLAATDLQVREKCGGAGGARKGVCV